MAIVLRSIFLVITIITIPVAHAQSCGSYKGQLEALLVLPAGKYRVDDFYAQTEPKVVTRSNGKKVYFDGFGYLNDTPDKDYRVNVKTYLDYDFPHTPLSVLDSTTHGKRVANGRLSCTYVISYIALKQRQELQADLQLSDSGSAQFFVPTIFSGDNPRNFALINNEGGAQIAFGLISASIRERDKQSPRLMETARLTYAGKLAVVQAKENDGIPEYNRLVEQCKDTLEEFKNDIKNVDVRSSEYFDKLGSWDMRFSNTQCRNTDLPLPKQWAESGFKPYAGSNNTLTTQSQPLSQSTVGFNAHLQKDASTPSEIPTPQKSPKELCADRPNFVSRGICQMHACDQPEYRSHPDCGHSGDRQAQ